MNAGRPAAMAPQPPPGVGRQFLNTAPLSPGRCRSYHGQVAAMRATAWQCRPVELATGRLPGSARSHGPQDAVRVNSNRTSMPWS